MKTSKKILNYYKKRMYHGRSIAARAFDFVTLRLLFFSAAYFWFLSIAHNKTVAVILSVIAVLMFSVVMALIHSMRLERFITKEQRRLTEESLRENLTLLSKQEFTRLASAAAKRLEGYTEQDGCPHYRGGACMIAALQKLSPATADDLLAVYRTARKNEVQEVLLYTAVPVGADAEAFIRRLSQVNIHVQPPEKLLALCKEETAVDTDSLVTQKLAEAEAEKKRKRAQPFASGQTRKYLFCTAVLAAASFLTHYPLYYRLLAGVSLALAGMSFFLNHPAKQKHAS